MIRLAAESLRKHLHAVAIKLGHVGWHRDV